MRLVVARCTVKYVGRLEAHLPEAVRLINREKAVLIDVSEPEEYAQGHAVGARNVPLAALRDAALSLQAGGVGFYPSEQFVHIDTGRVRRW